MTDVTEMPEELLSSLLQQAGPLISRHSAAAVRTAELHESFPLWMLPLDAVNSQSDSLQGVVRATDQWHSQLWVNGRPRSFIRGHATGGTALNAYRIDQIFESDVAEAIDMAITSLDEADPGPYDVRLIIAPAYQLHAFWLVGSRDERIMIVSAGLEIALPSRTLLSVPDFLKELQNTQYIAGITY